MKTSSGQAAVFFDRDGVLNVDTGYLHRVEDFRWVQGARRALRLVREANLISIVVTNQSGIARGFYREQEVEALHRWMNEDLRKCAAEISAFYLCPYHYEGSVERYVVPDHQDRKPNPGMLLRAIRDWNIDPERSVMFGDKESDMEAARRAGVAGVLFEGGDLAQAVSAWLRGRESSLTE